jgi:hypothetical protein
MKTVRDMRDTDHLSINLLRHDQLSSVLNSTELHHVSDHGREQRLMGNLNLLVSNRPSNLDNL